MLMPVTPTLADSVRLTENGLLILDRRVFPFQHRWVACTTVEEAARAIEDMVTQSSGSLFVAAGGMVLAARAARHLGAATAADHPSTAGQRLIATRPTNNHIRDAVRAVLAVLDAGPLGGDDLVIAVSRQAAAYTAATGPIAQHSARTRRACCSTVPPS